MKNKKLQIIQMIYKMTNADLEKINSKKVRYTTIIPVQIYASSKKGLNERFIVVAEEIEKAMKTANKRMTDLKSKEGGNGE